MMVANALDGDLICSNKSSFGFQIDRSAERKELTLISSSIKYNITCQNTQQKNYRRLV